MSECFYYFGILIVLNSIRLLFSKSKRAEEIIETVGLVNNISNLPYQITYYRRRWAEVIYKLSAAAWMVAGLIYSEQKLIFLLYFLFALYFAPIQFFRVSDNLKLRMDFTWRLLNIIAGMLILIHHHLSQIA